MLQKADQTRGNGTKEAEEAVYYTDGLLTRISQKEPVLCCGILGLLRRKSAGSYKGKFSTYDWTVG